MFEDTSIGSEVIRFSPIVAPTDWKVRAGNAQANLVRIHGSVSLCANTAGGLAAFNSKLIFAVIKVDADDASTFNPLTSISYIEHDVLWTHVRGYRELNESGRTTMPDVHFTFDIKAQRKLRSDDFVYLVFYNHQGTTVTGAMSYSVLTRALIVTK